MEQPGFQESKFTQLNATHYRTKRIVFDREDTLKKAPPHLIPVFNELFAQIDYIELVINYYDLLHGKRTTPPRDSLLKNFSEEKRQQCEQKAAALNQRQYLKMRHRLVELRTEQYTYRDSVYNTILPHVDTHIEIETPLRFDSDIEVRPFGLHDNSKWAKKIFRLPPDPFIFDEKDLQRISDMIWKPKEQNQLYFDFCNPEHILMLYKNYALFETEMENDPDHINSSSAAVFRTLKFYEQSARLNELQHELLQMKIHGVPNTKIASIINQKYHTSYNDNYISTIYRKKIIPTIADCARLHKLIMENIFYPENFKKCKDCGQLYLRDSEFFVKQHKAPDGYAPRCKRCSKKKREEEKIRYEQQFITYGTHNKNGTT